MQRFFFFFFCITTKRFSFKQLQVLSQQHLPHIIPFCLKNVKFIIWSAVLKHWRIPASKSREFNACFFSTDLLIPQSLQMLFSSLLGHRTRKGKWENSLPTTFFKYTVLHTSKVFNFYLKSWPKFNVLKNTKIQTSYGNPFHPTDKGAPLTTLPHSFRRKD